MAKSENWRINKSSIPAVEGAQALRALQKVAGAIGLPQDYSVRFSSQKPCIDFTDKKIHIGGAELLEEAPIPAEKFDILVGMALHEVSHHLIKTDKVWEGCNKTSRLHAPEKIATLQAFINIGEDIMIESKLRKNPNLAPYDKSLHDWAVDEMSPARPDNLMEVWLEYALGHKAEIIMQLPDELAEPMSQLIDLTKWLRRSPLPRERMIMYTHVWGEVKDYLIPKKQESVKVPRDDKVPHADTNIGDNDDSTMGNSINSTPEPTIETPVTRKSKGRISRELTQAIEEAIKSDSEDVTEQVMELAQDYTTHSSYPIIRSRGMATPTIKPNRELCKRLERIMTIHKRLQSRTMHGERYGQLDKRHLYRVSTDERVFSLDYKFPLGFPDTRILLDLSASMYGTQAEEVLEAAAALQVLVGAQVWCYNHDNALNNLVRVDDGKLIHKFRPAGDTPSGLAIIGVSLGMRSGLIIHFTDGECNVGFEPYFAHEILRKRGIGLINLIWNHRRIPSSYANMDCRQLKSLAEFPDALYNILIEQVKLRG